MSICVECKEEFPSEILSPLITSEGNTGLLCGVCALKLRNELHGLPLNTPFKGEIAQWLHEKAMKIKKKRRRYAR